MVRTTAAVAFAVLALSASTLAAPVDMSDEMIARDVDYEVEARDYTNYEVDAREFDEDIEAREVDFAEYDARDLEDAVYDAREEDYDYEARDFYDIEEYDARDEYDWEDIVERDATTTSAPASTITPAPTSNAPQSTGTSTVTNTKNGKATKTIITYATPTGCKKPGWGQQVKANWKKAWKGVKERREKRKAEREAKKAKTASTSASSTPASASSTSAAASTITSAPTATGKPTIKNRTTKGPDGTKTIHRTITAAQTPCPENKKRSYGYELDKLD